MADAQLCANTDKTRTIITNPGVLPCGGTVTTDPITHKRQDRITLQGGNSQDEKQLLAQGLILFKSFTRQESSKGSRRFERS